MNIKGKYLNKLIEVLSVQTNSTNEKLMVLFLDKTLCSMGLQYSIDSAGNVLVIKGEAKTYPCVVSHMDTVHNFVNNFEVVENPVTYVNKKTKKLIRKDIELSAKSKKTVVGVGGDDKCGVFACLYFLEVLPAVKVVFFSREEVGCIGSGDVNHGFFSDCRYIIQLDRRGKKDFITNYWGDKTISHELSSEVGIVKKKYGFKNATGTVTDSVKLWHNNIGISCMNISSGYYNPHTSTEYVSVSDLFNAIEFVHEMINTLKSKRYVSKPPKTKPYVYTFAARTYSQCKGCDEWILDSLLYKKGKELYCFSCLQKNNKNSDKTKNTIGYVCQECNKVHTYREKPTSIKGKKYCPTCAVLFACDPPITKGRKTDSYFCYICNKKIGSSTGLCIRYRVGHFYCDTCCPDPKPEITEKEPPKNLECGMCNQNISENDDEQYISGERVCNYCWNASKDDKWLHPNGEMHKVP